MMPINLSTLGIPVLRQSLNFPQQGLITTLFRISSCPSVLIHANAITRGPKGTKERRGCNCDCDVTRRIRRP